MPEAMLKGREARKADHILGGGEASVCHKRFGRSKTHFHKRQLQLGALYFSAIEVEARESTREGRQTTY